jgi:hypothetical protein
MTMALNRSIFCTFAIVLALTFSPSCATNENAHTTATTVVTPPPIQVVTIVDVSPAQIAAEQSKETKTQPTPSSGSGVDRTKPLLILRLPDRKMFRVGEVVIVDFAVLNAKLKGEGGDYRIRYFVDDDDARWVDTSKPFGLTGWLPGIHSLRVELIGADGWPYRNGDQNIITHEINVSNP